MTPRTILRALPIALLAALAIFGPQEAKAAGGCSDIDEGRCTIDLSTGVTMAYVEIGPAEGPAVILIHGLTDNIRSWALSMRSLHTIAPDLHILAIDIRGHGASSMPPKSCAPAPEKCFTLELFGADVVAFMKAKAIPHATLAGHSLGSFIVQEVALSHPEMVDHAILDATSTTGVDNAALRDYVIKEPVEGSWKTALEAQGKKYPDDFYDLTPLDADKNAATWIASNWVVDPLAAADFLAPYIPETANIRLGTWIGATKALLATDNTKRLEDLSVPTLVIWATQDSIFLQRDQDEIKRTLTVAANAHKTTNYWKQYGVEPLPASGAQESDIGHNIQWAAYDAVAKDIAAFRATDAPTAVQAKGVKTATGWTIAETDGAASVFKLGD